MRCAMKPLVTALINTHNHEEYIEQALTSVLEQGMSAEELEILVVDDGSEDRTPSIIHKFAPRVRHVRKRNGGQASAFNVGFAESRGQIIALLDGDDWWEKRKLETVVGTLEEHPEQSGLGHAYFKYFQSTAQTTLCGLENTAVLNLSSAENARASLAHWKFLQTSALTIRREVLARIVPIPEVLVFSADAPVAAAATAMGVRVLNQPLSHYRIHANNLYSIGPGAGEKLRRKAEMDDTMYDVLYRELSRLGVSGESISALLDERAIEASRFRLHTFGGRRLKTFKTEMRAFRSEFKKPSLRYLLFKYCVVGTATLIFSPQLFYELRDWYAERNLGQLRDQLFKNS